MLYFIDTTRRDARKVVASIRQQDRDEARLIHGLTDEATMVNIIMSRPSFTIRAGSVPVGLFGVDTLTPGVGTPWLVGTPALTKHARPFLRESRQLFDDLIRPYQFVTNAMLAENSLHRMWVEKWLGIRDGWTRHTLPNGAEIVRFTACVSPLPPQLPHS